MKRSVINKRDFVSRYAAGEFGNASPTWETPKDFSIAMKERSLLGDSYSLRNRVAGGSCLYHLKRSEVLPTWLNTQRSGEYYASEMAPHHKGIINGEVCYTTRGLNLFYGPGNVPMREALKQGKQVTGLQAEMTLRSKVDPSGYNWIKELLEEYPDHTVEFTSYSSPWGTLASVGHCTVIWEVRLY